MDDIEKGLRDFLDYWFAGLMQGLDDLDELARKTILHRCGSACAKSYTVHVFREAKQTSTTMDSFLQNLAQQFPGAHDEQANPNTIQGDLQSMRLRSGAIGMGEVIQLL